LFGTSGLECFSEFYTGPIRIHQKTLMGRLVSWFWTGSPPEIPQNHVGLERFRDAHSPSRFLVLVTHRTPGSVASSQVEAYIEFLAVEESLSSKQISKGRVLIRKGIVV
jgi:hypothetical protein